MVTYIEIKKLYLSNIVLFILLLFVIMYIIYNYDYIKREKFFDGQVTKPILITGILFLIIHMLMTWDDDIENIDDINNIEIPKYKLGQNTNESRNEIVATKINAIDETKNRVINSVESATKKYKIINNLNKSNNDIFVKSNEIKQETKLSNQDIFINKRRNKYGLKFL